MAGASEDSMGRKSEDTAGRRRNPRRGQDRAEREVGGGLHGMLKAPEPWDATIPTAAQQDRKPTPWVAAVGELIRCPALPWGPRPRTLCEGICGPVNLHGHL